MFFVEPRHSSLTILVVHFQVVDPVLVAFSYGFGLRANTRRYDGVVY
jgi:hypothetical protein